MKKQLKSKYAILSVIHYVGNCNCTFHKIITICISIQIFLIFKLELALELSFEDLARYT